MDFLSHFSLAILFGVLAAKSLNKNKKLWAFAYIIAAFINVALLATDSFTHFK